jgi:hypothetical protein
MFDACLGSSNYNLPDLTYVYIVAGCISSTYLHYKSPLKARVDQYCSEVPIQNCFSPLYVKAIHDCLRRQINSCSPKKVGDSPTFAALTDDHYTTVPPKSTQTNTIEG